MLQKLSGEWDDFVQHICIDVFHSRNSTGTVIYNQCANIMLRYAIKLHEGHTPNTPKQLFDSKVEVPPPPKPGDIKAVVAGLPWQVVSLHFPTKRNSRYFQPVTLRAQHVQESRRRKE